MIMNNNSQNNVDDSDRDPVTNKMRIELDTHIYIYIYIIIHTYHCVFPHDANGFSDPDVLKNTSRNTDHLMMSNGLTEYSESNNPVSIECQEASGNNDDSVATSEGPS